MNPLPSRIVLTGAESTGKTTLACDLAAQFGTVWAPEMARHYLDAKGELDASDVLPIAYAQRGVELWLEPQVTGLLICDTDVLSTILYARELYAFESSELERLLATRPARLYLLLDTDISWTPDATPGQREGATSRTRFARLFRDELKRRDLPFHLISAGGNHEARLKLAVEDIRSFLDTPFEREAASASLRTRSVSF